MSPLPYEVPHDGAPCSDAPPRGDVPATRGSSRDVQHSHVRWIDSDRRQRSGQPDGPLSLRGLRRGPHPWRQCARAGAGVFPVRELPPEIVRLGCRGQHAAARGGHAPGDATRNTPSVVDPVLGSGGAALGAPCGVRRAVRRQAASATFGTDPLRRSPPGYGCLPAAGSLARPSFAALPTERRPVISEACTPKT